MGVANLRDDCSGSEGKYPNTCATRKVLDLLVDKWAALILGVLGKGTTRFMELHRRVTGISQKMLTQTLRRLERDGFVQRTIYAEVPPRVEYSLTPLGRSLRELMVPIREWAISNLDEIVTSQQQFDLRTARSK